MYSLFVSKRIKPLEENPQKRLKQFVAELDNQISAAEIAIINAPDRFLFDKNQRYDSLLSYVSTSLTHLQTTPAYRVKASNGILFSRTPVNLESDPINLCTPEEVFEHCLNLATFVVSEKKSNCFGLCAYALSLSRHLVTQYHYRHINIQICHLFHWDHAFLKISYGPYNVFYDPWWQRCPTLEPHADFLIQENMFHVRMDRLVNRAEKQFVQTISHFSTIAPQFNSTTNQLKTEGFQINGDYGFDYCIICALNKFSNPSKVIPDPLKAVDAGCCLGF